MTISIREKIVQLWTAKFKAMKSGVDDYETTWEFVERYPLGEDDFRTLRRNALSILEEEEATTHEVGYLLNILRLNLEFFLKVSRSDEASTELNRALTDIKRCFLNDIYTTDPDTGKTYSLRLNLINNTSNIEFVDDFLVSGLLIVEILYRHHITDPRLCI